MSKNFITSIASVCILSLFSFVNKSSAQGVVNFPDANFKAALVGNRAINRNGDGEIQTSEAVAFKGIMNVGGLNISNLQGVEAFSNITGLYCNDNNLSSLNINANTKLSVLRCDHNRLGSLDVSTNTALKDLRCYVNSISSLDLKANPQLTILWCFLNPLESLSTSSNPHLTQLMSGFTYLRALDVSSNHELTYLDLRKNPLRSLNVKNGNNTKLTYFDVLQSSGLICIQVDDPTYSQANWTNVEPRVIFSTDCRPAHTEIVTIPDANFKAILVRSRINKNGDSEIQVAEAASYTEEIFAPSKKIVDLTGIEAFTSLTELHIYDNPITTLNLSKNTSLRVLKVEDTKITTLNVRSNTNLEELYCQNLQLTSLDVSQNINLVTIWCFGSKLTTLDISGLTKLVDLECHHNELTSLTLRDNQALKYLPCFANQLSSLDLSGAPNLTVVRCNLNRLTSLNVSQNIQLRAILCNDNLLGTLDLSANKNLVSLICTKNNLTTLDLSAHKQLNFLECQTNKLSYVNVKNGNNKNFRMFNSQENPNLTCVQVDDPGYSRRYWKYDQQTNFNTDCANPGHIVYIPDPNFKAAMLELVDGKGDGHPDGEVQYDEVSGLSSLDVSNRNITDLTGLKAFRDLGVLNCSNNQISTIHVNYPLSSLNCSNNQITSITGNSSVLEWLDASHNKLASFPDIFPYILYMYLDYNELTSSDWGYKTDLRELSCSHNRLISLSVQYLTSLTVLRCNYNELTSLNVANMNNYLLSIEALGNPALTCIQVDDVAYAEANWRDNVDPIASFSTNCADPSARIESITVYPNPTTDKVFIKSAQPINAVQVFDMIHGGLKSTQHGNEIDFSTLQKGVYNMKIKQGDKVTSVRIIKE